MFVGRW